MDNLDAFIAEFKGLPRNRQQKLYDATWNRIKSKSLFREHFDEFNLDNLLGDLGRKHRRDFCWLQIKETVEGPAEKTVMVINPKTGERSERTESELREMDERAKLREQEKQKREETKRQRIAAERLETNADNTLSPEIYRFSGPLWLYPCCTPILGVKEINFQSPSQRIHIATLADSLPLPDDIDIFDYLVTKVREAVYGTNEIPDTVRFRLPDCLQWLGLKQGGRQRKKIMTALNRLYEVRYYAESFGKNNRISVKGFSLIDNIEIADINNRETYIVVTLNKVVTQSIRAGEILVLPQEIKQEIRSSKSNYRKILIKILYMRLGQKDKQEILEKNLMALCGWNGPSNEFRKKLKEWNLPFKHTVKKHNRTYKYTFYSNKPPNIKKLIGNI